MFFFNLLFRIFVRSLTIEGYVWVHQRYRYTVLPWDSPWTWWLTFLGVDLGYYWFHRLAHGKTFLKFEMINYHRMIGRSDSYGTWEGTFYFMFLGTNLKFVTIRYVMFMEYSHDLMCVMKDMAYLIPQITMAESSVKFK